MVRAFPQQRYPGLLIILNDIGSDLRRHAGSITKLLGDQIFTLPIHWTSATAFPETATHAIDFGPGGLSGIGPFTSRNLEGRGMRVIVVGDKGKGDVELYNARHVRYEDWWAKKYAPRLVRTRCVESLHRLVEYY